MDDRDPRHPINSTLEATGEEAARLVTEGGWCYWTSDTKPFKPSPPEDETVAFLRQVSASGEKLLTEQFAAILGVPEAEVIAACEVLVAEGLLTGKNRRYIRSA